MLPTEIDEPCTCPCHSGKHLYHVVWKPCCGKPIQGGKEYLVFKMPNDENPECVILAKSLDEAKMHYESLLRE